MSVQLQRDISRQILSALYAAWEQNTIISLFTVQEEGKWDEGVFDTVFEKLEKRHGLIKSYGSSFTYEITPSGVLYVEDNEILPKVETEQHRYVRKHVLTVLAGLYDKEGTRADEGIEKICEGVAIDSFDKICDISLLTDLGYLEATSSTSFRITEEGLRHFRVQSKKTLFEDLGGTHVRKFETRHCVANSRRAG